MGGGGQKSTKSWVFFERVNRINKPLARLTKKKREDPNKIRNETGEVTTNIAKIPKNLKRILSTIVYQQTGQPRKNGQVSRNIQHTKTESSRNIKISTDWTLEVKQNL